MVVLQACGSGGVPNSTHPTGTVIGSVAAIVQTNNTFQLTGWACATGSAASIDVELYLGGASDAGGTNIGSYPANIASDPSIAANCKSTGTSYSFSIPLTAAIQAKYGAEQIYAYGISPSGFSDNQLLNPSGKFSVPQLIWFAPLNSFNTNGDGGIVPYAEVDYMQLFAAGAPWTQARSHTQVFKIVEQLAAFGTDSELQTIFSYVNANNLTLALEAGPLITSPQCGLGVEGYTSGAAFATATAQRIKALGGNLAYISMDEPLFYGHFYQGTNACQASVETVAQQAASTMQAYQAVFPEVQVGDIEPLDSFADPAGVWVSTTQEWIGDFQAAAGFPLAFLHDDVTWSVPLNQYLPQLQPLLTQQSIPFGMIFNGTNNAVSDAGWMSAAEQNIQAYNSSGDAQPAQVIFQTWDPYPTHVLPETSPTSLSYLVDFYFSPQAQLSPAITPGP
jgi:hypothetical protein